MPNDPWRWCRRIFASVDVVGSTQFKLRKPEDSSEWAYVFTELFEDFPSILRACFEQLPEIADGRPNFPMRIWKFVGDEILFQSELTRHEQAAFHVLAFKDALNQYASDFAKKPQLAGLSIKGTIWGAGFPVSNAQVATKFENRSEAPEDYLGPCVDQGFRLCGLADARRIPLSVDIAYMLAMTQMAPIASRHPLKVLCEEPKPHKGVSVPYPHIWLDRFDGAMSEEDTLLDRREPHDTNKLLPYLRELYAIKRPGLFAPFIVGDKSPNFNKVPSEMKVKQDALRSAAAAQTYTVVGMRMQPGVSKQEPPRPNISRKAPRKRRPSIRAKRKGQ